MIRPWACRAIAAGAFVAGLAGCGGTTTIREVPASLRAVSASSAADARGAPGGVWGKAEEVPGTAARNAGGDADVGVSCASAGNCSAGGLYEHDFSDARSFVVGEKNGTWGKAERVLINGTGVALISLSCASAGNCSAGGDYAVSPSNDQAFVIGEKNGTWGKAEKVLINGTGVGLSLTPLSCASAGNCSAGGEYVDPSNLTQAFVVGERNGTWGNAEEVPGTAALNKRGYASVNDLSCASASNCSAVGYYTDGSNPTQAFPAGDTQAFVVGERNGTWGNAEEVPGTAALNTGGHAVATSVSCASAGNCDVGGFYTDGSGHQQVFVAGERNGTWGKAEEVPGTAALNTGGSCHGGACVDAQVGVSCASAGNCSAGGSYTDGSGHQQAFVAGERNGTWGKAEEVPGTAALNKGGDAYVGVSCASVGNCSAGGSYTDGSGHQQAFVAGERNGTWGKAEEVPGTAALNKGGDAETIDVSCASVGNCSASGYYTDGSGLQQAFVVNETTMPG